MVWNMKSQQKPQNPQSSLDLAIIGSGPAALTAALYAARFGLHVAVYERDIYGGALTQISHLANFPGFEGKGTDLAEKLKAQASSAGAEFHYGTCESLSPLTIDGEEISARTILIATGSEPRKLDFELSVPVSYCALCDAPLYSGKNIAVIGGGNSAVGESLYLADIAKSVTIISHSDPKADSAFLSQVKTRENIRLLTNTTPTKELLDTFDAVFVFIGKRPATTFITESILDDCGYIITDEHYQTSIPHIFAAGDVRQGAIRQAITASAEGAAATIAIHDYLGNH